MSSDDELFEAISTTKEKNEDDLLRIYITLDSKNKGKSKLNNNKAFKLNTCCIL